LKSLDIETTSPNKKEELLSLLVALLQDLDDVLAKLPCGISLTFWNIAKEVVGDSLEILRGWFGNSYLNALIDLNTVAIDNLGTEELSGLEGGATLSRCGRTDKED
jgi:hypothetical protein